jgi:Uma2 family endonuclease
VAVRFRDSANASPDHQLNVRHPDIIVRDCEPYDVNDVRDHIQLVVEVTSESTFETDTTAKRTQYAAAGIPGYLVVHFDKSWSRISEIEEYRLDWSVPGNPLESASVPRASPLPAKDLGLTEEKGDYAAYVPCYLAGGALCWRRLPPCS